MYIGKPSPESIKLFVMRYSINFILGIFACVFLSVYSLLISFVVFLFLVVVYLWLVLVYEKYKYDNTCYAIYDGNIRITKGVIFKKREYVLKTSIQCTEVKQSILQKIYDVYTVIFYMTGKRVFVVDVNSSDIGYLTFMSEKG